MTAPRPPRESQLDLELEIEKLRGKIAKLEAVDRRHSNTHGDLASNVKRSLDEAAKAKEQSTEARQSVSNIEVTSNDAVLGAFRIVDHRLAERDERDAERRALEDRRHDSETAKLQYLYDELVVVKTALAAAPKAAVATQNAANAARKSSDKAAENAAAVEKRQRSQARWAWVRSLMGYVVIPILGLVANEVRNCHGGTHVEDGQSQIQR